MKRLVTVVLAAYMSISLMAEGVAVATWTGLGSENDLSDKYYAIVSKGDNGGVYLTSYSTIILIR